MDGSGHCAAGWGIERVMSGLLQLPDGQLGAVLPDYDLTALYFYRFGPQIGRQTILCSLPENDADDSGKMVTAQRDICCGEHQRSLREAALGPGIFFWERAAAVSFQITHIIAEYIGNAVDVHIAGHGMPHAEHTVMTLHKGDIAERSHDIVLDWSEWPKLKGTRGGKPGRIQFQMEPLLPELILTDPDGRFALLKFRIGKAYVPGSGVCYQLYGA